MFPALFCISSHLWSSSSPSIAAGVYGGRIIVVTIRDSKESQSDKASFDLVDACTNNVELVQLMNSGNNRNYGLELHQLAGGR